MKKNGYQIDDYESEDIIYRLHKVDKDKVSYDDFQDIFSPVKISNEEINLDNFNKNDMRNNEESIKDNYDHLNNDYQSDSNYFPFFLFI